MTKMWRLFPWPGKCKERSNDARKSKTKKGPRRIHDFSGGGTIQTASANVAPLRARGTAQAIAVRWQHAALHGRRPGTTGSDSDTDPRNGRQPRGNRNHFEHARENGGNAAPDGSVHFVCAARAGARTPLGNRAPAGRRPGARSSSESNSSAQRLNPQINTDEHG